MVHLFVCFREIVTVVKTTSVCDLRDPHPRILFQKHFGILKSIDIEIFTELETGFPLEDPGKVLSAYKTVLCHVSQGDGIHISAADELDGQLYDRAFALELFGGTAFPGDQQKKFRRLAFEQIG